ncbi:hypothetical protein L9F63_009990, partial [Diploptera punctata]
NASYRPRPHSPESFITILQPVMIQVTCFVNIDKAHVVRLAKTRLSLASWSCDQRIIFNVNYFHDRPWSGNLVKLRFKKSNPDASNHRTLIKYPVIFNHHTTDPVLNY